MDKQRMKSGKGFTLTELIVASAVMLVVILGTLTLYMRSNRISVDQQQLAELHHDVRASMFFMARDVRSAGVGLTIDIAGYFLEGYDAFSPGEAGADSIKVMGNFDDRLALYIENYSGGAGGGSANAKLYEYELMNAPYDCPDFYNNRMIMIVSTTCPGCFAFRYLSHNALQGCGPGEELILMQPGQSELNPPGGLVDESGCTADCWIDALVTVGQVKQYWLDTTGSAGDYSMDSLDDEHGYLGIPDTLYLTSMGDQGGILHLPLAQNIENIQFQYNGDLDGDGILDGFVDWDETNWTIQPGDDPATKQTKLDFISSIQQVRIWVLGKTERAMLSVSGEPPNDIHLYRRPAIANSPAAAENDRHRRVLIDSTSTIRNLSLNLYNMGTR
jgi:prepilin-type N-terminal cleavage/methylation domain-containing protein